MPRQHQRRLVPVRCAAAAAAGALLAAPLGASSLGVQGANPNTGTWAARVSVESACTADLHSVVTGAIGAGTYEACSSLTSDGDLGSGAATFRAGDRVVLAAGFSVAAGASLTVEIDPALYPDAWVQDDTPDGETVYAARFYLDPSALTMTAVDRFYHFLAFDAAGDPEVRVGVNFHDGLGEKRMFLEVFEDDGGVVTTEGTGELALSEGWQFVEVGWQAGAGDGGAYLCVDTLTACANLIDLDNDTGAIDFVRWGAVDVPSDSDLADLDFDDFESCDSAGGFADPSTTDLADSVETPGGTSFTHDAEAAAEALVCALFADGFEFGDFSAWSGKKP